MSLLLNAVKHGIRELWPRRRACAAGAGSSLTLRSAPSSSGNPSEARDALKQLLENELAFHPVETADGPRYEVEGRVRFAEALGFPRDLVARMAASPEGVEPPPDGNGDPKRQADRDERPPSLGPAGVDRLSPDPATGDPVETALAEAVVKAAGAGEWSVVATLAAELQARRLARAGDAVVDLAAERARRAR